MGKRIIQQRRGKGSLVYRVKNKASLDKKPGYLKDLSGEFTVIKLISSNGHSAPIAKLMNEKNEIFYNFATDKLFVGQKIKILVLL